LKEADSVKESASLLWGRACGSFSTGSAIHKNYQKKNFSLKNFEEVYTIWVLFGG
jgi:hypothetical protein